MGSPHVNAGSPFLFLKMLLVPVRGVGIKAGLQFAELNKRQLDV